MKQLSHEHGSDAKSTFQWMSGFEMINGVEGEGIGESESCSTDVDPGEAGANDVIRDVLA